MDLSERFAALDFTDSDRNILAALRPRLLAALDSMLQEHHKSSLRFPDYAEAERNLRAAGSDLAGEQARRYWETVLTGAYDDAHQALIMQRAEAYFYTKFPPRWSYAQYTNLFGSFVAEIVAATPVSRFSGANAAWRQQLSAKIATMFKIAMLELDLTATTYRGCAEAARVKAEEERRKAQNEADEVVASLTKALSRLAEGDLTDRLRKPFAKQFEGLRADYNASTAKLESAVIAVSDATGSITSNIAEIARASDHLSRRTEQQAANLEQSAAALAEMSRAMREAADGAAQAQTAVARANAAAQAGQAIVRDSIETMGAIAQSSARITEITSLIDEIALQTNLLALNAGVEAARAGDQGKGFAVVASEVRALALRSADAAKEIKSLLTASSAQVTAGVKRVGATSESLNQIAALVEEINGVVAGIASGAAAQAIGLGEVTTAIGEVDRITQENAAMAEQSNAATRHLQGETQTLDTLVAEFSVGGRERKAPLEAA